MIAGSRTAFRQENLPLTMQDGHGALHSVSMYRPVVETLFLGCSNGPGVPGLARILCLQQRLSAPQQEAWSTHGTFIAMVFATMVAA